MSDVSQGPGWWEASDGRWYPPESHPNWGGAAPSAMAAGEQDLADWAPARASAWDGAVPTAGTGGHPEGLAGYPQMGAQSLPSVQPVVGTTGGGRFTRGLRLVGVGFAMARDEPGLMMVPVVAFVLQLVILGIAALVLYPTFHGLSSSTDGGSFRPTAVEWVVVALAGVATMFVSVVSHATIIARVMARFHGQGVSNTQAARAALSKSPQLLGWAFVNYIVMSILRNISNRGIIGLLVGSALRAGWFLASFFVVPVILFEGKGAISSIKRSVQLCKGRWGENIVGNGALGVIGFVAILLDVAVAVLLGAVFVPLGVVVGVIGLAGILLVMTVASGAFNAALYWYAVTDQSPGAYSVGDLQAAYRQNKRRTGLYGV